MKQTKTPEAPRLTAVKEHNSANSHTGKEVDPSLAKAHE